MISKWAHNILNWHYDRQKKRFLGSINNLEVIQRQVLAEIIAGLRLGQRYADLPPQSYEQLIEKIEVRDYRFYEQDILLQKSTGRELLTTEVQRFEPTSGSTSQRKWIPYSRRFLSELNAAAAVWLSDLYAQFPGVAKGRHYWSLSWMPEELRQHTNPDDSQLFPWHERFLLRQVMVIPPGGEKIDSQDKLWWATLRILFAASDLSLVSVWSPTLWLRIVDDILKNWDALVQAVQQDGWGQFSDDLKATLGAPPRRKLKIGSKGDFKSLWPQLALISCWGSSTSENWFAEIKSRFDWVEVQEKGLWATEGVVTIPFQGYWPLAYQSHFYEFRDLETQEIVPSWKLQKKRCYQPILWNSTGLLRYQLQDQVEVMDFLGQVPSLRFMGRLHSVDLVGEKLDNSILRDLQKIFSEAEILCAIAVERPQPHYVVVVKRSGLWDFESELQKYHHYKLARELKQLLAVQIAVCVEPLTLIEKLSSTSSSGNSKPELIYRITNLDALQDVLSF